MSRAVLAASILVGACTTPAPAPRDAPVGSLGTARVNVDPYDPDAAVGARADALFSTCGGGPESGCHSYGAAGLQLRLGRDGDLVNVRSTERPEMVRVRPFNPADSYLYLKVLGDGGIEGGRMPLDSVFDSRIPILVKTWIAAGAPSP